MLLQDSKSTDMKDQVYMSEMIPHISVDLFRHCRMFAYLAKALGPEPLHVVKGGLLSCRLFGLQPLSLTPLLSNAAPHPASWSRKLITWPCMEDAAVLSDRTADNMALARAIA